MKITNHSPKRSLTIGDVQLIIQQDDDFAMIVPTHYFSINLQRFKDSHKHEIEYFKNPQ